jgi:hypothetical protein
MVHAYNLGRVDGEAFLERIPALLEAGVHEVR